MHNKLWELRSEKLKKPMKIDEQLSLLKERNLEVDDDEIAKEILQRKNYYYLTGYLQQFKKEDESYVSGTNFENIYRILKFDMKLRNILMYPMELIERTLKSNVAYYFSQNYPYGNISYRDPENFSKKEIHKKLIALIDQGIENNKETDFIKHHIIKYNKDFPIWVVVEIFTLGNLEKFYSILNKQTKRDIADIFGYPSKLVENWIEHMRRFRNMLAHSSRLYDNKLWETPLKADYKESTNRIFDYIVVMEYLTLNRLDWNEEVVLRIEKLFKEYENDIDIIKIGFPENWKEILMKR